MGKLILCDLYCKDGVFTKTFDKKLRLNKFISENIDKAYCIKLYAVKNIEERKRKTKAMELSGEYGNDD